MLKQKKAITIFALTILALGISLAAILKFFPNISVTLGETEAFLASKENKITLYKTDFSEGDIIPRGTKIRNLQKEVVHPDTNETYQTIEYENRTYYVKGEFIEKTQKDSVKEKEMFIRTQVTLYKEANSSIISGVIKKGEKVEILDFDKIGEHGIVNKYKIKYQEEEGYVRGKYLVTTHELAVLNYDEEGNYQVHKKRVNTQGGGSAANLDYYPYPKANFSDNAMPEEVRSLYLNINAIKRADEYIEFAKNNNINAFVVDIKDNTMPGYQSEVMKTYSPTNYARAGMTLATYRAHVQKLLDAGFYVIGRITVFKDSLYVMDHPESAILDTETKEPFKHNGSNWPSAFRRDVWEFNVELAKEAVKEVGFHEIQFDYVRFPDRTKPLEDKGLMDMLNVYGEDKAVAIQAFLMYACDDLHELGVYVSADVFGESAHHYVTGYGQYWSAISNVVDVISGMPYPDHFSAYEYGFKEIVWTVPGKLLEYWGKNYVAKRQAEIPTPAVVRTWIQAYNAIRNPYVEYGEEKVYEQIKGLKDAGLTGGYMTWNSASSLSKYNEIANAFKR